jgi:uncharacterized protein (TIGR03067 family)
MRSSIVSFGAAILLLWPVGMLVAQQSAVETERQKFQGTWGLVSGEVDGQSVPAEHAKRSRITFEGNKIALDTPHQSKETIVATFARLDPTKTPKEMHWVRTTGPNSGTTMMAIYEFRGDDQYRICFDPSGQRPPRELASKKGTGHICHTWRRMKP